jgi:acetyl-CoA acetyltransferase
MSVGEGRGVAVVGCGNTDYSAMYGTRDPLRTAEGLGVEALRAALDDAGLSTADLDGLLCCRIPGYDRAATMIGTRHLKVANSFESSGRMAGVVLQYAASLIATGQATTIALIYGNNGRSVSAPNQGDYGTPEEKYDLMYGMTSLGAYIALMWQRYASLYGVPDDALAPLALSNRRNAQLNPEAVIRKPLSHADYVSARYIAEPLRLYDYCVINDGGVAMIVTSADRAKDLKSVPVIIEATASSTDLTNFYTSDDFFHAAASSAAAELYGRAGITPQDVDVMQVYDNFTPITLFSLESFGFCPRGEGWTWIQAGRIERDGELPLNTSGGHTSEGYMQGWALMVEAVRQARGDAGERQVPGVELSQYVCVAPIVTSHLFRRG